MRVSGDPPQHSAVLAEPTPSARLWLRSSRNSWWLFFFFFFCVPSEDKRQAGAAASPSHRGRFLLFDKPPFAAFTCQSLMERVLIGQRRDLGEGSHLF